MATRCPAAAASAAPGPPISLEPAAAIHQAACDHGGARPRRVSTRGSEWSGAPLLFSPVLGVSIG